MIVDASTQLEIFKLIFLNFLKLSIIIFFVFYKIPQYIFPQDFINNIYDRIVYNTIFMLGTIMVVVPFLLFFKLFSIITLLLVFFIIKALILRFYNKDSIFNKINLIRVNLTVKILEFFDYIYVAIRYGKRYKKDFKIKSLFMKLPVLKNIILFLIIFYIIFHIDFINFISLGFRTSDMPQYLEWVSLIKKTNILYPANLTIGAYFFGAPVIIFFLNFISNIDLNILLNIYPLLFIFFLIFSLFYVIYKITGSFLSGIFTIIFYSFFCLSPLATHFLGYICETQSPDLINLFGLKFLFSTVEKASCELRNYSFFPFIRLTSGLPYEMALTFFPLYLYFFIMIFEKKKNLFLILYTITLYLIFAFHGGTAIILIICSILILLNAILFKKMDFSIFKKGILAILIPALLGNLWIFAMLKYGIPRRIGVSAPILDKIFKTKYGVEKIIPESIKYVTEIVFTQSQLVIIGLILLLILFGYFNKNKRFFFSSIVLSIVGVFIVYFETNLGFPEIINPARSGEFVLVGISIISGLYFYLAEWIFVKIFTERFKYILTVFVFIIFILSSQGLKSWNDSKYFYTSLNKIQYSVSALEIYKIKKLRNPFTWTVVDYVQSYPRVLDAGYHVNIQTFLKKYNPADRYLKIPTEWIYIFKENLTGRYRGSGEWFYRWRKDINSQLETWIKVYSSYHNNIKIFDERKYFTVYEINNQEYIQKGLKDGY